MGMELFDEVLRRNECGDQGPRDLILVGGFPLGYVMNLSCGDHRSSQPTERSIMVNTESRVVADYFCSVVRRRQWNYTLYPAMHTPMS